MLLGGAGNPEADGKPVGRMPVCAVARDSKERDAISLDMMIQASVCRSRSNGVLGCERVDVLRDNEGKKNG